MSQENVRGGGRNEADGVRPETIVALVEGIGSRVWNSA